MPHASMRIVTVAFLRRVQVFLLTYLHAKFGPDPFKTVAVHKEQRTDAQTDRFCFMYMYI